MSKPIPKESLDYEEYVDELRRSNAELLETLESVLPYLRRSTDTHAATIDMYIPPAKELRMRADAIEKQDAIVSKARKIVEKANSAAGSIPAVKTITIHLEGGLVQDVTGIPPGVEVRVEDYDEGDTSHPSWDEEKGCFVTVYGGEGA